MEVNLNTAAGSSGTLSNQAEIYAESWEAAKNRVRAASEDIYTSLSWKDYKAMKTKVDLYLNGLVSKLETHHLNETEIRFCVLTLLDLPLKKIADIICYSYPSGIKTLKKRIADKLETNSPNLRDFLLRL